MVTITYIGGSKDGQEADYLQPLCNYNDSEYAIHVIDTGERNQGSMVLAYPKKMTLAWCLRRVIHFYVRENNDDLA